MMWSFIIIILIFLLVIVVIAIVSPNKARQVIGEMLFGVGIALMMGSLFKFNSITEGELFYTVMAIGTFSLFFGGILKIVS